MSVHKQVIWVHGCNGQIQDPKEADLMPAGQGAIIKDISKHEHYYVPIEGWPTGPKPNFSWVHYAIPTPSAHLYTLGKKPYAKAGKSSGGKPSLEAVLVRFKCGTDIPWDTPEFTSALAAVHVWDAEVRLHPFYNFNVSRNFQGNDEEFGLREEQWTTMAFRLPEKRSLNYGLNVAICMRFDVVSYGTVPVFYISSVGAQFASLP